ncbi:MAG: ABC transporter ATP-binding protein [Ruminococcaceae bacterium]|nr:ABC transporter ATP-binding protein [Oscillospiraceae bacterium]
MKPQARNLDEKRQKVLENRRKTRQQRYSSYRSNKETGEKPQSFVPTAKRLVKYLFEHKVGMVIVLITCILSTIGNVVGPTYIGEALDVLSEQVELKIHGQQISAEALVPYLVLILVAYGGMAVFSFIQQYTMAGVTAKIVRRLREDINHKLSHLPLKYFDSNAKGDILSRIINDIDNISNTLQHNMVSIITSIVTIVGVFGMMLATNWFLTLAVVAVVPPAAAIALSIMRVSKKLFKKQWDRMGELNGHVEEMYTGHKIVRLFGQEQLAVDEFNDINDELTDVSRRAQFISGIIAPFINLVDNIGYIIIAVLGGFLIVNNGVFAIGGTVIYDMGESFTIGGILTFITYSKLFTSPISQLAQIANNLQSSMASSERVFALLDEPEEDADSDKAKLTFEKELKFEDVSFSYDPEKPLMEHLDITVKRGGLVALVGPTGAGKTTFVNLLMRFYDVNGGKITIDGTDIRDVPRDELRSLYGMVLQDTWLFNGSVKDNIRYSRLGATDEEVIAAAKAARAEEFIKELPDGYETILEENGANLSQGQRQLLTIARALLKDPQILILDEATSSVDTRTELLVQAAMSEIMKGRTNFVIAHRLSTIRKADEILFIDGGAVKERGTHDQLMAADGLYADMYYSQFGGKVSDKKLDTDN